MSRHSRGSEEQRDAHDDVVALIHAFEVESRRRKQVLHSAAVAMGIGTMLWAVWQVRNAMEPAPDWPFLLAAVGVGLAYFAYSLASAERRREIVGALAASGDVRAIGPLLEALLDTAGTRRREIIAALVALLPRTRERGRPRLRAKHLRMLEYVIRDPRNLALRAPSFRALITAALRFLTELPPRALVMAALQAWGQVGDARCVDAIERLARVPDDEEMRAVASACLAALRNRLVLYTGSGRLPLPNPDAGRLLRPAAWTASSAEGDLVRPALQTQGESAFRPLQADSSQARNDGAGCSE